MITFLKFSRAVSFLLCIAPVTAIIGSIAITLLFPRLLPGDSVGLGIYIFGLPLLLVSVIYYFLVHRNIVRSLKVLTSNPDVKVGFGTYASLTFMFIVLLLIVLFILVDYRIIRLG